MSHNQYEIDEIYLLSLNTEFVCMWPATNKMSVKSPFVCKDIAR